MSLTFLRVRCTYKDETTNSASIHWVPAGSRSCLPELYGLLIPYPSRNVFRDLTSPCSSGLGSGNSSFLKSSLSQCLYQSVSVGNHTPDSITWQISKPGNWRQSAPLSHSPLKTGSWLLTAKISFASWSASFKGRRAYSTRSAVWFSLSASYSWGSSVSWCWVTDLGCDGSSSWMLGWPPGQGCHQHCCCGHVSTHVPFCWLQVRSGVTGSWGVPLDTL